MEDDVFGYGNPPPSGDREKSSYGRYAYKRVQRLRRKGKRRGIEVPYLGYELTKPEKPRIAFWIAAGVSAAIFVGILVGIGFLYNEFVKMFSDLGGLGDLVKILFKPDILGASFGLSALPGLLLIAVYLLIAVLFALPIVAAVYFYRFVRDAFYMASCSKEEFAKGSIISSRIFALIVVLIVAAVVFVILLANIASSSAKLYIGLIFGGLALALGGLLVLMILEKTKCGKWFEGLAESKKQDYLEHESALRSVNRRLNAEKSFRRNIGR